VRNQFAVREAMADTPLAALKVQELLREVRVDYSKTRVIEAAVAAVVDILSGLADEEVSPSLASAFARDLGVPEDKARFKFRKPEWVRVVGSYGSHTIAKPVQQVDIAVRIPKASLFSPLLPAFANSLKRRKKSLLIAEFGYLSCAR
jgi:hypothetical protein